MGAHHGAMKRLVVGQQGLPAHASARTGSLFQSCCPSLSRRLLLERAAKRAAALTANPGDGEGCVDVLAAERRCDDVARLAVPDRAGLADIVRVAAALRVHGHPDPCPPQNQPSVLLYK